MLRLNCFQSLMARAFPLFPLALLGAFACAPALLPAQSAEEIANSLLWRQTLGGAVIAAPSAQMRTVTLLCDGGFVRTYSDSGKMLWEFASGGRLLPFITRSNTGMTFFGRANGSFYALNRAGSLIWEKRLGDALAWMPLIGWDGRIFVFLSKRIVCFTASGNQLWELTPEERIHAQPVANTEGGFIAPLRNGALLMVSQSGALRKVELAEPAAAVLPGNYPELLVIYANGDVETLKDGVSAKKRAQEKKEEAKSAPSAPKGGAPSKAGANAKAAGGGAGKAGGGSGKAGEGAAESPPALQSLGGRPVTAVQYKQYAAVLLDSARLVLWQLAEERIVWVKSAAIGIQRGRLLFDERGLYLFSMSGAAGWMTDGSLLWNMKLQGSSVPPALSDSGILFAGGTDWLLYAYQVEHRSLPSAAKASFPYNLPYEGNYGFGSLPSLPAPLFFSEEDIGAVLKQISRALKSGSIGESERYVLRALLYIVNGGDSAVQAGLIERLEALRLLSFLGSRETIPFLLHKLSSEHDRNIMAGIVETLGKIGVDPDQTVLEHFDTLIPRAIDARDSRLLSAIAEAVGRMCRFSGPPVSDTGARLLVSIAAAASSKVSADIALQELKTLVK